MGSALLAKPMGIAVGAERGRLTMTIRIFLSIIGALGIIHGIAFIVAPDQVASIYGLQHSPAVALVSRFFGGALLAWGAILWLARSFRDEAAVRAVLISTCIAEAVSLCVAIAGTLAGTMNSMGWVAVLIYLFGAVGCGYFLIGQKQQAAV
jgi:hypothetical protein